MRYVKLTLLILTLIGCFAAHIPYHIPELMLKGDLLGLPSTKFTKDKLLSGEFQRNTETRLTRTMILRELWVRTEMTLTYYVFKELYTPLKTNPVVLGKDNWLFEKSYLNNANGVSDIKRDLPLSAPVTNEEAAKRLGAAAKTLRRKGIDFVMYFYPHKAWTYPEKIDPRWMLEGGSERARAGYEDLLAQLKKYDVPFLDGTTTFKRLRAERPDLPLFPRGGTHWNTAATCFALNDLLGVVRKTSSRQIPSVKCEIGPDEVAGSRENDLAHLVNMFDIQMFNDRIPTIKASVVGKVGKPITFFYQGTSFSGEIVDIMWKSGVADKNSPLPAVYYRSGATTGVDWDRDVMTKDLVIFEQSQGSHIRVNTMEFLADLETQSRLYRKALAAE